jgi:MerR family redox-sensitive transcriptional activator SoxR
MVEVKRQLAAKNGEIRAELGVGEVARRSGVAVSALHFYEAKGLIRSARTRGNQRRFARSVLRRIAVIKVAQKAGIPLATIARALDSLPQNVAPTPADWRRLSSAWRRDLDSRIRTGPERRRPAAVGSGLAYAPGPATASAFSGRA